MPSSHRKIVRALALVSMLGSLALVPVADACTRILWNTNKLAVFVGRTMDFPVSTEPVITVLPRGMARDGGMFAGARIDAANPARWTSRYGSIVTSTFGAGTADGLNEKGVAMHLLYFIPTDFGARDPAKKGLQAALWGQFVLDNAASVAEALSLMEDVQPLMVDHDGIKATVHLAIEDATGDSAIIEYVPGGKKTVYHNRDFHIMTNDPSYDQQLANRATYNFDNATRQTPIPGNTDAKDRFIRADYYRQWLPEPKNTREAIAGILAIARNVSVPFGAPNRVTFANGVPSVTNFSNYRVLTPRDMPKVTVDILQGDPTTTMPGGVGEAGVPCVAPAIANAYHRMSGKRVRELPFHPGATMSDD